MCAALTNCAPLRKILVLALRRKKDEVHVEDVQMDEDYEIDHLNTKETLHWSLAKDPFLVCMEVLTTKGWNSRYVLWKPSRDFTRPLGPSSGLKGLLYTLNAIVIPTKILQADAHGVGKGLFDPNGERGGKEEVGFDNFGGGGEEIGNYGGNDGRGSSIFERGGGALVIINFWG
ncbi:hypothetical protein Tco_1136572 [Tanacetum coccineum]